MSGRYMVVWTLDVDGCDVASVEEAARKAWATMRRPGSTANVFEVEDPEGVRHVVDLDEIDAAAA